MSYTTTIEGRDLSVIRIPSEMEGEYFEVSITPLSDEEASKEAFRRLKGIAGEEISLDKIREERLHAYLT